MFHSNPTKYQLQYGVKILVMTSFKDTCYIEILPINQKSKGGNNIISSPLHSGSYSNIFLWMCLPVSLLLFISIFFSSFPCFQHAAFYDITSSCIMWCWYCNGNKCQMRSIIMMNLHQMYYDLLGKHLVNVFVTPDQQNITICEYKNLPSQLFFLVLLYESIEVEVPSLLLFAFLCF